MGKPDILDVIVPDNIEDELTSIDHGSIASGLDLFLKNIVQIVDTSDAELILLEITEEVLPVEYDGKIKQSYGAYDRKPDWEKVEAVLTGFTRKIEQRTKKEQLAMSPAV